jgi:hypothetical protein
MRKLERLIDVFSGIFISGVEYAAYEHEIKFNLIKGLSTKDKEILELTRRFSGNHNQSPEEKGLMKKRSAVVQKVNLLFKRLQKELFPRWNDEDEEAFKSPPPAATPIDSATKTGGFSLNEAFAEASLTATQESPFIKVAPTIADMQEEQEQEQEQEQVSRPRYAAKKDPVDHDLFETPLEMLVLLDDIVASIREKGLVVFEPCAGNDAIVNYLEGKGITVIARDKYTKAVSHDVLTTTMPVGIDVVLTNPPFNLKYEIIARLKEYGKPSILLLPLETMATKKFHEILGDDKFDVLIPIGRCRFLHAGKFRDVGSTAWFLFSPSATGNMTFKPLGNVGDVELGSQDTEGGRDYDSDEEEERVRDQAIENDPNTKWTPEGYEHDDFVVPDSAIEAGGGGMADLGNAVEDGVPGMADLGADGERVLLPGQTIIRVRKPKQPKK